MSILACEKNEQFTSLSISQYIQYIIVIPFYLEFILENNEKNLKKFQSGIIRGLRRVLMSSSVVPS